jgi:Domain of unknown function (DUF4390)
MVNLSLVLSTTAFFMRFYKKLSLLLLIFAALICTSSLAFAASSGISIKSAELSLQDDYYGLNADVDMSFDKEIEEAINKGVPLTFLIEFQIVSPRKYWFDDEIVTATQSVSLSYHALSRQYLVNRGSHQLSFASLGEAMQELVALNDWKVVDKSLLEKPEVYKAALLIRLDQTKLPKAIQVDTIASEKWNISSQKFEWTLKEASSKVLK